MNITTLSFGASLIASAVTLLIFFDQFKSNQRCLFTLFAICGIPFLAHGTGYLRKAISSVLRWWRKSHPVIAIVSDLSWSSEKGTYTWSWSEMSPWRWVERLEYAAKQRNIKTKIVLIKVKSKLTRYFLEQYSLIINPYGSVYPEVDIKQLTVWNTLVSYVLDGGEIVSVSDIPFYYAYDPIREIRYDVSKRTYHYIHQEYEQIDKRIELRSGTFQHMAPFSETPFLSETHTEVRTTESIENGHTIPLRANLKFNKDVISIRIEDITDVAVNRAFLIGVADEYGKVNYFNTRNIRSIVEDTQIGSQLCTPLCYIDYGKGRFLISLLFFEYELQSIATRNALIKSMISIILDDARRKKMSTKDKAEKSASQISDMADLIAKSLKLNYPTTTLKAIIDVPLKQLEDELETLRSYVNTLK